MNNPPPLASPQSVPPPKSGGGCCAVGCLTLVIGTLVVFTLVIAGIWLVYSKTISALTSPQPIAVQLETPSEAQFAAANEKLTQIRSAAGNSQPMTIEFTAADLNALIARHPEFEGARRKLRVAMADSLMTLDMSVPLASIPLPRLKRRWFNGSATFGFAYDDGSFDFNLRSIGADEESFSTNFAKAFSGVFDDAFSEGVRKAMQEDRRVGELWPEIKSAIVVDDKLVVTTKTADEPATP